MAFSAAGFPTIFREARWVGWRGKCGEVSDTVAVARELEIGSGKCLVGTRTVPTLGVTRYELLANCSVGAESSMSVDGGRVYLSNPSVVTLTRIVRLMLIDASISPSLARLSAPPVPSVSLFWRSRGINGACVDGLWVGKSWALRLCCY